MASTVRLHKMILHRSFRFYSTPIMVDGQYKKNSRFTEPSLDLKMLDNRSEIEKIMELRKLSIDPDQLKSASLFIKHLQSVRNHLQNRIERVRKQIVELTKSGNCREIERLEMECKMMIDDGKGLSSALCELDEKFTEIAVFLPNEIHGDTPTDEDKVMKVYGTIPQISDPVGHVEIGAQRDLIDYRNPSCYYLKDDAALFELSCCYYFGDALKSNGFLQFSNPDCVRNVIAEGCGKSSTNPDKIFIIKENFNKPNRGKVYNLLLVGGSSIYPFCAYHTNQIVHESCLPLRYFTIGRQYGPTSRESNRGLFDTWQRTTNDFAILTRMNRDEMMAEFRRALDSCVSAYERLGRHFRVVYVKASDLETWETLRASIQMYSCREAGYVEVGKLSISDTFLCRRLRMCYQISGKDDMVRPMMMVSGTAIDVTKVLACILEEDGEKFSIPEILKSDWFT